MKPWPKVRLGEVLRRMERAEKVDASMEYRLLGIRLDGQGPFLRETVMGTQTSAGKLFRVATGDFIYSRLFACRGAFGVISEDLDGCYVSGEFPTFLPVPDKLDVEFLRHWFRLPSVIATVDADCTGSTPLTRNRFKENFFLALEIPLPPLAEQRRVVARIEELAAQIHEARNLRREAAEEAKVLPRKTADELLGSKLAPRKPLIELLSEPLMNGLSVPASRLGSGTCFAKAGVVNSGVFNASETKMVDVQLAADSRYWLREGDIVVSRGNSPDFVGRSAVYEGNPPNCAIPDLLIRIRLDPKQADTRFVSAFFHSTEARRYIATQISGTSSTMPKISQPKLEALPIPVPPLPEQRRIVAELDALQAEVDALKHLQSETAAELDALLPALLDRAFKGEL